MGLCRDIANVFQHGSKLKRTCPGEWERKALLHCVSSRSDLLGPTLVYTKG